MGTFSTVVLESKGLNGEASSVLILDVVYFGYKFYLVLNWTVFDNPWITGYTVTVPPVTCIIAGLTGRAPFPPALIPKLDPERLVIPGRVYLYFSGLDLIVL